MNTGETGIALITAAVGGGTGMFGIQPGAGVIVIQSGGNVGWISVGLTLLRYGTAAQAALFSLLAGRQAGRWQHLMLMDAHGQMVAYTGDQYGSRNSHLVTANCAILGTRLSQPDMLQTMLRAWETSEGELTVRLLAALQAAFEVDAQRSRFRATALKVVDNHRDLPEWDSRYDLRVDDHAEPAAELERLAQVRHGQILDREGHRLLKSGDVSGALLKWKTARELLSDQEEVCFWQAVALADSDPDPYRINLAGRILATGLTRDGSLLRWQAFVQDLLEAGLILHTDVPERLTHALEQA
jgi:uncharacterized Ntn-hydrolase superfamily protein